MSDLTIKYLWWIWNKNVQAYCHAEKKTCKGIFVVLFCFVLSFHDWKPNNIQWFNIWDLAQDHERHEGFFIVSLEAVAAGMLQSEWFPSSQHAFY